MDVANHFVKPIKHLPRWARSYGLLGENKANTNNNDHQVYDLLYMSRI